jgi:hypothetical protein
MTASCPFVNDTPRRAPRRFVLLGNRSCAHSGLPLRLSVGATEHRKRDSPRRPETAARALFRPPGYHPYPRRPPPRCTAFLRLPHWFPRSASGEAVVQEVAVATGLLARSLASSLFTVERGKPRSFGLHLDRSAELLNSAGNDHQIPMLDFVLTPNHLANRPDRVDNGRSGWVCLEGLQRL